MVQIINGVRSAQQEVGDAAQINPRFGVGSTINWSDVSFDIAVTASESSEGAGSVRVLGPIKVGVGGGITAANSHASRLQFTVPLILPKSAYARGAVERDSH